MGHYSEILHSDFEHDMFFFLPVFYASMCVYSGFSFVVFFATTENLVSSLTHEKQYEVTTCAVEQKIVKKTVCTSRKPVAVV